MEPKPKELVHLVGIGGIGMSAIAELLLRGAWSVQGSDTQQNSNTSRLEGLGIKIFLGHEASHVTPTVCRVIASTAVPETNPELQRARELGIPVQRRGEALAELMKKAGHPAIVVTGTHGKTTTTALIGHLLNCAGLHPTIVNGGIMQNYGSNVLIPSHGSPSSWWVVEGDESDGTMLLLPRRLAVLTNIDLDHMTYWKTEEALLQAFFEFVEATLEEQKQLVVACSDCPRVTHILKRLSVEKRRQIITYGLQTQTPSDISGLRVRVDLSRRGMLFDVESRRINWRDIFLPLHGSHNVQNALAAAAVAAHHLGVSETAFREALASFRGTARRFTVLSEGGSTGGVTVIDDYAHHPAEIKATLEAARDLLEGRRGQGRIVAVHEPHRYSRVRHSFAEYTSCFGAADYVVLLPIYSAGEPPIEGISSEGLAAAIGSSGVDARAVGSYGEAKRLLLQELCAPGDIVICCGAGPITKLAHELSAALTQMQMQIR